MNKKTLQEYNNRLNTNNTSLQNILNDINNLPDGTGSQDKMYARFIGTSNRFNSAVASSYTMTNASIHSTMGGYRKQADLVLVAAMIRGNSYTLSDNLTIIAESEWQEDTYTGGSYQKVIIAKADLESTEDYVITQGISGRMEVQCFHYLNAGEPEFVETYISTTQENKVTILDDDLYLYIAAIMWKGTNNISFTDYCWCSINERSGVFTSEEPGEINIIPDTAVGDGRYFMQVAGIRIPYKRNVN